MIWKRFGVFRIARWFCFLVAILVFTIFWPKSPSLALAQEVLVDPSFSQPVEFVLTVDIAIDCAGLPVKGVEVVLTFDPLLLNLEAISPGPWYTEYGQDFYFFDYTSVVPQGTIHFASSVLEGTNDQSSTIAVCHFTASGYGMTPLIFQEVDVRDINNVDLGFGHSEGDMILLGPTLPVTASSFGALKVLFR